METSPEIFTSASEIADTESRGHQIITQAVMDFLPEWQQKIIAGEKDQLINLYCLFPDLAREFTADGENTPAVLSAAGAMKMAEKIGIDCHRLWLENTQNYKEHIVVELFTTYLPNIIRSLKENDITRAMQYFGVLLHFIEDVSCPGHAGATLYFPPWSECYFSYVKSVKPSFTYAEPYQQYNAHAAIDNCPFSLRQLKTKLGSYNPLLLGKDIEKISKNTQTRMFAIDEASAKYLVSMLEYVVNKDTKSDKYTCAGAASAANAARLGTDLLYSIMCIVYNRFK